MEILLSILIGIGLAAATGFRVFVPFLVLSIAARSGQVDLSAGFDWIASEAALWTFVVATLLEIGAYYFPWLDNLLDSVATPAAVIAGVVLTAAATGEMSPLLSWSLAILAGGGVAATFQGLTAGTRGISSLTTAGLANPLVATGEVAASTLLSVAAVLLPVVAFVLVVVLLLFALPRIAARVPRRRTL